MKILFVCSHESIYRKNCNPFVSSLIQGLKDYGHIEVDYGLDYFWNNYSSYDLIYFQWPDRAFTGKIETTDLNKISTHLELIKKHGIKTVITCHDLKPHNGDTIITKLYELVYSKVDAFHHLGNYSYQLMKSKYPQKYHFIVPHHIADSYFELFNTQEAKSRLSIHSNDIVIASFGAFRNRLEKQLFLTMVEDTQQSNVLYLAPRLSIFDRTYTNWIIPYIKEYLYCRSKRIRTKGLLSEDQLRLWLSATDIVFIQRKSILNSGNVPLAFAAGKVVVGPNIGNVGDILKETGNLVFDPNNSETVKSAVLKAMI